MLLYVTVILIASIVSSSAQCTRANCQPPDCRCFLDGDIPGNLTAANTPQVVLITLGYEINSEYEEDYQKLFTVRNPNNCPITATIFVQDTGTNYGLVKKFYDAKFEIGIQSPQGEKPKDQKGWDDAISKVKGNLVTAGIADGDIRGFKANALSPGGIEQFNAMGNNKLVYDFDCGTTEYDSKETYKWPYTFDFPDSGNTCNGGALPTQKFPGKWGISIPALSFKGTKCATAAGCIGSITSKKDAFDIFYDNFVQHYEGNRSPFVLEIDPIWVKDADRLDGTIQFIEYVRAAFDDVWILNAWQAVEWVRNPVAKANINDFDPWKCT